MPQKQGFRVSMLDASSMARAAPPHAAPQSAEALWTRGREFHRRNGFRDAMAVCLLAAKPGRYTAAKVRRKIYREMHAGGRSAKAIEYEMRGDNNRFACRGNGPC